MQITFYNFNKRYNSTIRIARPGTAFDCIIKEGSSLLTPTIRLKWSSGAAPDYNYAFISAFGNRYYFIEEWTFEDRQWTARMTVDVLATYRPTIRSLTKYVLRSASQSDDHVLDNYYPATGEALNYSKQANFGWAHYGSAGGAVIATVIGHNSIPAGNYVAQAQMSVADTQLLINNLLNRISSEIDIHETSDPFGLFDLCAELIKIPSRMTDSLIKYVPDIMWFPFTNPNVATPSENLKAGIHEVLATSKYNWITNPVLTFTQYIDTSTFPGSDPDWEWAAPYASYTLHFMPFGDIPLDSFDILRSTRLKLDVKVDTISGIAVLIITMEAGELGGRVLTTRSAQLGIKLPYGSASLDVAGMMSGAATAAISAVNYFTGAEGATAAGLIGSVANAASLSNPSAYSSGSTGTGASITGIATLYCRKLAHVPIDNVENGKPLCKLVSLNTVSGFTKVSDGTITSLTATGSEIMQIKSYLEGGYFND